MSSDTIIIIKEGALGDVVRTSFFLPELRAKHRAVRILWVASPVSAELLRGHPHLDDVLTRADLARMVGQSRPLHVYSLDDERECAELAVKLAPQRLSGAFVQPNGELAYTDDVDTWFGMGLLSRYGREEADRRKVLNTRSHAAIFGEIFQCRARPYMYVRPDARERIAEATGAWQHPLVGINLSAGRRWPSKKMALAEAQELVRGLDAELEAQRAGTIVLLGGSDDRDYNAELASSANAGRLVDATAQYQLMDFAALVGELDYLVTSDSLALHLAVGSHVPQTSLYAPTSAAEIETFGTGAKVRSTASDYCSFKANADVSTLTAERVLTTALTHMRLLGVMHELPSTATTAR